MRPIYKTMVMAAALIACTVQANAQKPANVPAKITAAQQQPQKPVLYLDSASAARLKVLQEKVKGIDKRLKDQEKNLNKVYRDVTPATEEMLNNREDSIYLSILSEKRNVELEMAEVKKTGKIRAQQIAAQQQATLQPVVTAQPARPGKPSKPNFPRRRPVKPSKK